MKNHFSEAEICSLIERFEARKLPKQEWTHAAHLVVAIWYSAKYSPEEALALVRQNIRAHNQAVGTPNSDSEGYHETITRFWLMLGRSFLENGAYSSIAEACNTLILSPWGNSKYPLSCYSPEILYSVRARQQWVEPDLGKVEELINANDR